MILTVAGFISFERHLMAKELVPAKNAPPPRPSEYLPAAIQKAVVGMGIKHPAAVYPTALGASAGIVGWILGIPALYMAAIAGVLLGPAWVIVQIFFLNEKNGSKYIHQLNLRQEAYQRYLKTHLEEELQKCRDIEGIESYAGQGTRQLENIQIKFANVRELLEMKLRTGELTFGRFLGAAEQVTLSVLDNLKQIAGILKSAASIQPGYIRERLNELDRNNRPSPEDEAQKQALTERLDLWQEQLKKVHQLLTSNEAAMTEMEKISAAVAEWQTDGQFADTDFESAIARLQELAGQADEYNL